ncbi:hypothetical protein AGROH133_14938 (plasmid) [Agrobacterium tumefaciens]|nr:hypothetical protein AGROH133_14938 [Agrobacterium tumefaciens]
MERSSWVGADVSSWIVADPDVKPATIPIEDRPVLGTEA